MKTSHILPEECKAEIREEINRQRNSITNGTYNNQGVVTYSTVIKWLEWVLQEELPS